MNCNKEKNVNLIAKKNRAQVLNARIKINFELYKDFQKFNVKFQNWKLFSELADLEFPKAPVVSLL